MIYKAILLSVLLIAPAASATLTVYVPFDVRVNRAQHIVEGELTDLKDEGKVQVGTIKVTRILKGDPVKTLKVR